MVETRQHSKRDGAVIKAPDLTRSAVRAAVSLAVLAFLAGCNFLPSSGPYTTDILTGTSGSNDTDGLNYKLVPVTIDVVRVLAKLDSEGLVGTFTGDRR